MKQIAVFVKAHPSGLLRPCRVTQTPDGCVWECAVCEHTPLLRVSFGVLSGFWRCPCGAEVELLVDGQPVSIQDVNVLETEGLRNALDKEMPYTEQGLQQEAIDKLSGRANTTPLTDDEFARQCGFALPNGEEDDEAVDS